MLKGDFNQAVVHSLPSSLLPPPGFHSQSLEGEETFWTGRLSDDGCSCHVFLLPQGSLSVLSLLLAHSDTCSPHTVPASQHDCQGAQAAPATGTAPIKGRLEGTASSQ